MKLVIVSGQEDWEGLYVDGVLTQEGHSLRLIDVLEAVRLRGEPITGIERFTLDDLANEHLNDRGCLPDSLELVIEWMAEDA